MQNRNLGGRSRRTGFTLLELLVVLVILALLGSVAGPRVVKYLGSSKTKTAKLQIQQFGQGLDLYLLETGKLPSTREGLEALVKEPSGVVGWNGPYISATKAVPKDPWANDYSYESPGRNNPHYDIISLGADNRLGGEGENEDINNWDE